jgi:aminoglycoside phosphotransferase (APT) family kinase protein
VSWIHGDFWPGNLLVAEDGMTLTGIVDWDLAENGELPMHDVLNLLMATQQFVKRRGLGDIVRGRLNGAPWPSEIQAILEEARYAMPADVPERALLLLFWLRFIATYLRKCPDRARDEWWMNTNVERVLQTLGGAA